MEILFRLPFLLGKCNTLLFTLFDKPPEYITTVKKAFLDENENFQNFFHLFVPKQWTIFVIT